MSETQPEPYHQIEITSAKTDDPPQMTITATLAGFTATLVAPVDGDEEALEILVRAFPDVVNAGFQSLIAANAELAAELGSAVPE